MRKKSYRVGFAHLLVLTLACSCRPPAEGTQKAVDGTVSLTIEELPQVTLVGEDVRFGLRIRNNRKTPITLYYPGRSTHGWLDLKLVDSAGRDCRAGVHVNAVPDAHPPRPYELRELPSGESLQYGPLCIDGFFSDTSSLGEHRLSATVRVFDPPISLEANRAFVAKGITTKDILWDETKEFSYLVGADGAGKKSYAARHVRMVKCKIGDSIYLYRFSKPSPGAGWSRVGRVARVGAKDTIDFIPDPNRRRFEFHRLTKGWTGQWSDPPNCLTTHVLVKRPDGTATYWILAEARYRKEVPLGTCRRARLVQGDDGTVTLRRDGEIIDLEYAPKRGLLLGKRILVLLPDEYPNYILFWEMRKFFEKCNAAVHVGGFSQNVQGDAKRFKAVPDVLLSDINADEYDAIVFLTGESPQTILDDPSFHKVARDAANGKGFLCGLGMAPVILARAGVLRGHKATGREEFKDVFAKAGATYSASDVVVDGNIITGNNIYSSREFAEAIAEALASMP